MAQWARKTQIGKETTAGTAVAATTVWRGPASGLEDVREPVFVNEQVGIAIPSLRAYTPQIGGAWSQEATEATFEQLPYILQAGIKKVASPTNDAGSGASGKIWTFDVGLTSANTIQTYTIETGDNQQAEEMEYSFVTDFTLSGERGQAVMMSSNWQGRQVKDTTFTNSLTVPTVSEMMAGNAALFIDDSGGTIGSTAKTATLLSWQLNVTTGWRAKYVLDKNQLYFDYHYFDPATFAGEFSATYEYNAVGVAERGKWRDNKPRLIRLNVEGPALTTGGTGYQKKTLRIDMATAYTKFDPISDDDGNTVVTVTGRIGYSATDTLGLKLIVVNELSALP